MTMMFCGLAMGSTQVVPSIPATQWVLSLDGVDDRLYTPSLTFTEVIMDFSANPQANEQYINAGTSRRIYTNWELKEQFDSYWTVYKGDTQVTTNTDFIINNTRLTLRAVGVTATNVINFLNNPGTSYTEGKLYSIKILNGSTLIAHYDLTKGDQFQNGQVKDETGNGNNATLVGGTFIQEVA